MTRRSLMCAVLALGLSIMTVAGWAPAAAQSPSSPVRGGSLRVALVGELPTLDWQFTTSFTAGYVTSNIYEGLFALDAKLEPRPMLAERVAVSGDRKSYTVTLRRGVIFHTGREMASADVVASLNRWLRISTYGKLVGGVLESVSAPDAQTVVIRLKEPFTPLVAALAWPHQAAVVYPREVIEEAGTGQIKQFVGTGPYRFVEHIRDRHYRLERFDRYQARTEPSDGLAGRKGAYLDSIFYVPVPDAAVRLAGLEKGEFHQAQFVPTDEYERLRSLPSITPWAEPVPWWLTAKFNFKSPLFSNPKLREAFQLALNKEDIMRGTVGPPRFWRLDPSLMVREQPLWSDVGDALYRKQDVERAKTLMREAGYAGQPVRWLSSMAIPAYGISAQVAKTMLERAGFKVDLQMLDFATLLGRWAQPEGWDVASGGVVPVPDPAFLWVLLPTWPGWYQSPAMEGVIRQLERETAPAARKQIWDRGQQIFYEELPAVKLGDFFWFSPMRKEVKGFNGPLLLFHFNTWLEK